MSPFPDLVSQEELDPPKPSQVLPAALLGVVIASGIFMAGWSAMTEWNAAWTEVAGEGENRDG